VQNSLGIWRWFFATVAVLLVTESALAQVAVQQAQSHIDDQGCLFLEATARVQEPTDDLFNVMARPEAVYSHSGPYSVSPGVFIGFPFDAGTYIHNPSNSWSVTRPSSKILQLTTILGASGPPPQHWVEYGFNWKDHIISEKNLLPTNPSDIRQELRVYALSPSDDSTTSIRYTSTRCFADKDRAKIAPQKSQWTDIEKYWMTTWLRAAVTECEWLRTQPSPDVSVAATPNASPIIPSGPTATATPIAV
jgi:hypothetical protein